MSVLEAKLEEEKKQNVQFNELFVQQQEISKAKIEVVESKYESIKQFNIGLAEKLRASFKFMCNISFGCPPNKSRSHDEKQEPEPETKRFMS